jgi:DNA polymerase elongation subunit (family B)
MDSFSSIKDSSKRGRAESILWCSGKWKNKSQRDLIRRRDTPKFVYNAQMKMIEVLAEARNFQEFVKKIPESLKVMCEYKRRLLAGEVSIWDLVIKKHLSKNPDEYKQMVNQAIVAKQLLKEGL